MSNKIKLLLIIGVGVFSFGSVALAFSPLTAEVNQVSENVSPTVAPMVQGVAVTSTTTPTNTAPKVNVIAQDSDPTVNCQFRNLPSRQMKRSECDATIECEVGFGNYHIFYSQDQCTQAQAAYTSTGDKQAYLNELRGLNSDLKKVGETWKQTDQLMDCRLYNPSTQTWYTQKTTSAGCVAALEANKGILDSYNKNKPVPQGTYPSPQYSQFGNTIKPSPGIYADDDGIIRAH